MAGGGSFCTKIHRFSNRIRFGVLEVMDSNFTELSIENTGRDRILKRSIVAGCRARGRDDSFRDQVRVLSWSGEIPDHSNGVTFGD